MQEIQELVRDVRQDQKGMPHAVDVQDWISASAQLPLAEKLQDADDQILAGLEGVAEMEYDFTPTNLKNSNSKWRVVSAVQKAIRRGDGYNARRTAYALHEGGQADYLWRRLGVVALEDIGVANLPVAVSVLMLARRKKYRDHLGALNILMHMVTVMAESVKDRAVCNTAASTHDSDEAVGMREQLFYMGDDKLREIYAEPKYQLSFRVMAGLTLMGATKVESNGKELKRSPERPTFMQAIDDMEMPPAVRYCVEAGSILGLEGLFVSLPFVYKAVVNEFEVDVKTNELPPVEMMAGIPSVAFDMHTQEGKRALAYFSKANDDVREWLSHDPDVDKIMALGLAVFFTEGGEILDKQLSYEYQQEVLERAKVTDFAQANVPDEGEIEELLGIVRHNLKGLNYARKRIVLGRK